MEPIRDRRGVVGNRNTPRKGKWRQRVITSVDWKRWPKIVFDGRTLLLVYAPSRIKVRWQWYHCTIFWCCDKYLHSCCFAVIFKNQFVLQFHLLAMSKCKNVEAHVCFQAALGRAWSRGILWSLKLRQHHTKTESTRATTWLVCVLLRGT